MSRNSQSEFALLIVPEMDTEKASPSQRRLLFIMVNPRAAGICTHAGGGGAFRLSWLKAFRLSAARFAPALVWMFYFLFLSLMAAAEKPAAQQKLVCILLEKEGKVDVARQGAAQFAPGQTNQSLAIGDRLRTGLRSRATLRWSDLSVVRVDELTSMEIQPPAKAGNKPEAQLRSGAAYFFSREKPTEVQFRTPVASGAIRGTEFNLAVEDNGRTVISLIDGEVDLAAGQAAETLRSGQQGTIEPGGAIRKTALVNANSIIQWVLYYPAVVAPEELGLTAQEKQSFPDSLRAYESGDLLQALAAYPENRAPASDAEHLLRASLLLAAGRVDQVEADLKALQSPSPISDALRELIATVKHQAPANLAAPATASQWMARSYYEQSRSDLPKALAAAQAATQKAPNFGAAWIRVAELQFSFGRVPEALAALNRGLELSPRNAEGLALKGFLLAAQGDSAGAMDYFNRAISADGALANAWLGRGLVKIRTAHPLEGLDDLQVAATLEPQRAVLRSYLGKAFVHITDTRRADKELALAKKLDPNDPTSWLYSALLDQQENRINEAVDDLQQSQELNRNRSVFRSQLLLDQDQAVRSANLAAIYRDAGMFDISVQEASRAVSSDYGNYSAHLFLAESYDALRDPNSINLRYETPTLSELLVADLLAPPSGGLLSQNISQQEYSRFFDADHIGLFSSTEYLSRGAWQENFSQYGSFQKFGYALDGFYKTDVGQRPNNDNLQKSISFRAKPQLTAQDSLFFQVEYANLKSGDLNQYFDQNSASRTFRAEERQEPNLLLGYHREWSPGNHTLLLASRFNDTLFLRDTNLFPLFLETRLPLIPGFGSAMTNLIPSPDPFGFAYRSELTAYSVELQQIQQIHTHTLIAGARYQTAEINTLSDLERQIVGPGGGTQPVVQPFKNSLERISAYAYDHWQIFEPLRLTAGVTYDRLHFPLNTDTAPISNAESSRDQVSPKVGLLWTPLKDTHLRFGYTRSLGGVFFDQSVRLEPTQIGGFNQAFRSLIPESVVGLVPATHFETFGAGLEQIFKKTGTYVDVDAQLLRSHGNKTVGIFTNSASFPNTSPDSPSSASQQLDYEERSLIVALNQLISKEWSVGARYKLTHAHLDRPFLDIPANVTGVAELDPHVKATLHQLYLYANYYHPSGFFGQANGVWFNQSNSGYSTPLAGDDFWQLNLFVGYRFFQRRMEARLGLLNVTDQDYRLNPLTLYNDLPRDRTLAASFKFYF